VISNFLEFRRDGKVIPEGMTSVQMITAGWEPDKVLRLKWDWDGHPIELTSPYGLLSRIVRSREYLAVLEDTDAVGSHAKLSVYLPDGTLRGILGISWSFRKPRDGQRTRSQENISGSRRRGRRFRLRSEWFSGSIATAQPIAWTSTLQQVQSAELKRSIRGHSTENKFNRMQ
jgi:hypothetical protein